jgi:hypothetical protein
LNAKHRAFEKNFNTEMQVDGTNIPLNHFVQETVANMIIGLLKTLKEVKNKAPASINIRIKKLPKKVEVDATRTPKTRRYGASEQQVASDPGINPHS